jgi:hypothetical membrane protein
MKYPDEKIAGILFFLAAAQFVVIVLIAEALYPGYSISQNYISDLGVGPSALLFNACVFLQGVLIIGGTYFLQRAFNNKILTVLLILAGLGSLGVGLFPENSEPMHSISALLIFLFGGFSAIYSFTVIKRPLSLINILLGVLSLSALLLFAVNQYLGVGVGGMERLIVYPILVWMITFSGYLMASPEKP